MCWQSLHFAFSNCLLLLLKCHIFSFPLQFSTTHTALLPIQLACSVMLSYSFLFPFIVSSVSFLLTRKLVIGVSLLPHFLITSVAKLNTSLNAGSLISIIISTFNQHFLELCYEFQIFPIPFSWMLFRNTSLNNTRVSWGCFKGCIQRLIKNTQLSKERFYFILNSYQVLDSARS